MRMLRLADHELREQSLVDGLAALDHAPQRLVLRLALLRPVPDAGDDDRADETPEGERRKPGPQSCCKTFHNLAPRINDGLHEARCGPAAVWMHRPRPRRRSTMVRAPESGNARSRIRSLQPARRPA